MHSPPAQVRPSAQARPQAPQWSPSRVTSRSQPLLASPSQSARPASHAKWQAPSAQVAVAPAGAEHNRPQAPQSLGVVSGAGEVGNLRYLHCALCNTEWNLVRVKCSACDATEGIGYRYLETGAGQPGPDAVRAETCEACKSYLKIVYAEKAPVDPVADDLATLALDILVDEAGYSRSGPNLLLVPGG